MTGAPITEASLEDVRAIVLGLLDDFAAAILPNASDADVEMLREIDARLERLMVDSAAANIEEALAQRVIVRGMLEMLGSPSPRSC